MGFLDGLLESLVDGRLMGSRTFQDNVGGALAIVCATLFAKGEEKIGHGSDFATLELFLIWTINSERRILYKQAGAEGTVSGLRKIN
ncbi:MAG: hypothetical protein ACRD27_02825 [Terracidiphilus sp.]